MKKSGIFMALAFVLATAFAFTTKAKLNVTVYTQGTEVCNSESLSSLPSHCTLSTETSYCTTANAPSSVESIYSNQNDGITCTGPYFYH